MKLTRSLSFILIVAFILGALRLYGAYRNENQHAVELATQADAEAKRLYDEVDRRHAQAECNNQWLAYKNAQLKNELARLEGARTRYVSEPTCNGYASTDTQEALRDGMETMDTFFAALNAREYAVYEWEYSQNRRVQTKVIALRVWAALTGAEMKQDPARLEADWDKSHGAH